VSDERLNPYSTPESLMPAERAELPAGLLRRQRVWTVFVAIVLALVLVFAGQIAAILGVVAWLLSDGVGVDELEATIFRLIATPGVFIGLGLLSQFAIGGTALLGGWLSPVPWKLRLGLVTPRSSLPEVFLLTAGSLVPFAVGMGLAFGLAEVIDPDPTTEALYENLTPAWALPFVLFIALAPGLCEELLFRGYCQRRFLERWHPAVAILVSSLIFALFHVDPHTVVFAFPLGIWIGLMAWHSGSIWPGVLCHAAINGLWNIYQLSVRFGYLSEEPAVWLVALVCLAGLAAFIGSIVVLRRPPAPTDTLASPALPTP
jgi:membrane protease YdiL (CAAX protease family)